MRFIDEVKITVISGNGGPGAVSFRREKYIPFGGPDGGNGGRGGDVFLVANKNHNTLIHIGGNKVYRAGSGEAGAGAQRDGKAGEDLLLEVPVGTIVRDVISGDVIIDLVEDGQKFLMAKGGLGGLGNAFFKTSTNQAPQYAQSGLPGVTLEIRMELKLLADIGLVGLPNAGKSTLISVISAARPKVADYPFTTLVPHLGVVKVEQGSLVVADVPGLIEDANLGKGLGIKFLKHLERTTALVHLVDCSGCEFAYEAYDHYVTIRNELQSYGQTLFEKKEIVCLTKVDALTEEKIEEFQQFFEEQLQKKVLPISAVSGKNLPLLINLMVKVKSEATET